MNLSPFSFKLHLTYYGSCSKHHHQKCSSGEGEPLNEAVVTTGPDEVKRDLGGLRPYSSYSISVSVFNSKGDGPESDARPFHTPEGGKSSKGLKSNGTDVLGFTPDLTQDVMTKLILKLMISIEIIHREKHRLIYCGAVCFSCASSWSSQFFDIVESLGDGDHASLDSTFSRKWNSDRIPNTVPGVYVHTPEHLILYCSLLHFNS